MRVAYACPACGYRAPAVSFEEAEGFSYGVNANPELAKAEAENRARSRLLATIHAMPCPRCGMHPREVLSAIDECIRANARRATLRLSLRLVALAAFAAVAFFVFLIAMDMVPTVPPVLNQFVGFSAAGSVATIGLTRSMYCASSCCTRS